ncbi:hypothetical protein F4677DRAFT_281622 [Hypoxylon crocopeplum]|nr:hypothetical protein F4677DRAFT_281622 [Hypoxylon crocopeplum]
MVCIERRSDENAGTSGLTSADRAKTVGLVVLAIILVVFISHLIVRYWIKPLELPPSRPCTPQAGGATFIEQSQEARLNALRLARRPKRTRLTLREIDLVAPEMVYSKVGTRENKENSARNIPRSPSPTAVPFSQAKRNINVPLELKSLPTASVVDRNSERSGSTSPESAITVPPSTLGSPTTIAIPEPDHSRKSCSSRPREDGLECSICLEGYKHDDLVRETPCRHLFHKHCLEWWLVKHQGRCPLCQKELKPTKSAQSSPLTALSS